MRMLLNTLMAVALVGLLLGAAWHTRSEQTRGLKIEETRSAVHEFQRQLALRSALKDVPVSDRGYPMAIDPKWFENGLPENHLLDGTHPWLEIAHEEQRELYHPPDPIAIDRWSAAFWYNPHTGAIRARVPARTSQAATIELYNRVNGTRLW